MTLACSRVLPIFIYLAGLTICINILVSSGYVRAALLKRQVVSSSDLHNAFSVLIILEWLLGYSKFPLTPFTQVEIALSRSSLCLGASLQPPSTTLKLEQIIPSPCMLSLAVGTVQLAASRFPSIIEQVQASCLGWHRVIHEDGITVFFPRYFLHHKIDFPVVLCGAGDQTQHLIYAKQALSHWTTPSNLINFLNKPVASNTYKWQNFVANVQNKSRHLCLVFLTATLHVSAIDIRQRVYS